MYQFSSVIEPTMLEKNEYPEAYLQTEREDREHKLLCNN